MKEIRFLKFVSKVNSFGDPINILFDIGSSTYCLYDPVEKKIFKEGFRSAPDAHLAALHYVKLLNGVWCSSVNPVPLIGFNHSSNHPADA